MFGVRSSGLNPKPNPKVTLNPYKPYTLSFGVRVHGSGFTEVFVPTSRIWAPLGSGCLGALGLGTGMVVDAKLTAVEGLGLRV